MLTELLGASPDDVLSEMLQSHFQLNRFLNDNRMKTKYDWILSMTRLLELITTCTTARERITMILEQVPDSSYIEGVYTEIRNRDFPLGPLRFHFIQSFLKVSIKFLAMLPHSSEKLIKVFERIAALFTKSVLDTPVRALILTMGCF